jgi:hypothetical protein
MSDATKWMPKQILQYAWMPVFPKDGAYNANGSTCYATREECQAECDRRNADLLGHANADIERLERELSDARSRKAIVEAPL